MKQVWKFYSGLANFGFELSKFKALMKSTNHGDLFKIQCAFESQQPPTCDMVVKDDILSLNHNGFLTPSNFTELAYVLTNTGHCVSAPSLRGCVFGEESAQVLVKKAGKKVTALFFQDCVLDQLKMVNYFLRTLPSLQMLDISGSDLDRKEIKTLTSGLNNTSLHVLIVGSKGNSLYSEDNLSQTLADAFQFNCIIYFLCAESIYANYREHLHFHYCGEFHYHNEYPYLNMSTTKLGLAGIRALCLDLARKPFLTRLNLVCCDIDCEAASCLAIGLKHCRNLKVLELGFNSIGDTGAVDISKSIAKFCSKLTLLDLNHNNLSDIGILVVTDLLKGRKLRILCGFNNITKPLDSCRNNKYVEFHTLDFSNRYLAGRGCKKINLSC